MVQAWPGFQGGWRNHGEPWLPHICQGGVRGVRSEACAGISCRIRTWVGLSAVTGASRPLYAATWLLTVRRSRASTVVDLGAMDAEIVYFCMLIPKK